MKNLYRISFFAFLVGATFCWLGVAEASHAGRPEIGGDFGSYLQSELPNPLVLYVFTPSGSLAGYAVAHRNEGYGPLKKIRSAIRAQDFHDFHVRKASDVGKVLTGYLSEQGYKIDDVVSKEKKYSLLLVIADTKNGSCATLRQFQQHYEQAINNIVKQPQARGSYRLTILKLSADVPLTCKN
jgi:hypothetical protein